MFLGFDGASTLLASQSWYKSRLEMDSDGGPLIFPVDSSLTSLEPLLSFVGNLAGFSVDPYLGWRGKMTFLPLS